MQTKMRNAYKSLARKPQEKRLYMRPTHRWKNILWHIDLLLGNKCKTNNETTTAARQRTMCNSESTTPRLYDLTGSIQLVSAVQLSTVEWSELVSSQLVRGLLQFGRCELLLLEDGSWGTGIVREPRVRGTSAVGSRYQATTGEDTADWEDLVHAVVKRQHYSYL
jgi:hypothetical protein